MKPKKDDISPLTFKRGFRQDPLRGVPLLERRGKNGKSVLWDLKFIEVFGRVTNLQNVDLKKLRALNELR